MPAGLLERLSARVTFVAGKGGVGKTTTAGGLALGLADAGTPTHLLSTDPAHSLGDLFGCEPGPGPTPSPCTDRLVLEELDAARLVEERLGTLAPGLRELIDRGTYLDLEDADSLLGASMPGLDELGGALRVVQLSDVRLVVDSAPTGHLLRLLEAPDVVRSWVEVFDAMADKAAAVAVGLVGRSAPLDVEAELERLSEEAAAFEKVAAEAEFVVVTAPGGVVAAETRRLIGTLRGRGYRVAATVAFGRDGVEADVLLPYRRGIAGCAALRSWWAGEPEPERDAHSAAATPPGESAAVVASAGGGGLPVEATRELVVFAGKGGVGKSTCAAAAAVRLSESSPVLLMGADPAGSLHDILDGGTVAGLEVRELEGEGELDRLRSFYEEEVERAFASIGLDRAARMDRAVIESLWQLAPPGVDELMAISRLAEEAATGTTIVLDPAPTGHFLRLVSMPELAMDWLRRIMHILLKYGAVAAVDDLGGQLLRFARRFRELRERLLDADRTAIIVVTLDEAMARAETDRLVARLRTLGLPLGGVVVNRATAPVEPRPDLATWRVPELEEPRGVASLREFTRAWERVT